MGIRPLFIKYQAEMIIKSGPWLLQMDISIEQICTFSAQRQGQIKKSILYLCINYLHPCHSNVDRIFLSYTLGFLILNA